jgi:hypothetical protein
MIGPISLGVKQMGERSAGNPHAAFDVAGAGNVARSEYFDRSWRASPRPYLTDLAGDPYRHHLRRRHLGLATHPVTSRFPFDPLKMFETLRAGGFTNQQARTLTYVILDLR